MFSKFAALTLSLFLQWENYSFYKNKQNGGPEEDRGFMCVVWRPEARQDWVTKPLVSIGAGFTTPGSW